MAKKQGEYKVQVTWLGRAAFKLVSPEGKIIFIDPWLKDNPKCPAEYKDLPRLKADLILFSHGHGDHQGDTVELSKITGAPVVVMVDLSAALVQQGVDASKVIRLSFGGAAPVAGVNVSMVPAWHIPSAAGIVVGFSSGFALYHAGDTCLFSDMALIKTLYAPQLALLPIGGTFTMDEYAASLACKDYLRPQYVIPMHYPARSVDPAPSLSADKFRHFLEGGETEVIVLNPGETHNF
jgi:L-ascorbate metabolism protein UlaG (beta-lactamase superfamily)